MFHPYLQFEKDRTDNYDDEEKDDVTLKTEPTFTAILIWRSSFNHLTSSFSAAGEDAKELFDVISDNTNIEFDHPENIKDYIQHLLSGDIEDAYGENPNEAHSDRSQVGHTTQNGVGDLNYHFTQNNNCSITTPKKFKSIGIHGYKYLISVYLTDIIHMKTYRIYEVFALRFLHHIQKDGSYLNIARFEIVDPAPFAFFLKKKKLLTQRRSVKEEMSKENALKINDDLCIGDWIKIPDNTPTNTKFFL
ncbi:hypothetical protein C2G38_2250607 [Gigaspora rosea]|uniref:Uncharacterized protein n=1 Tax=Gigaspora rosea TaxID=44941 RepID=A0A397UNF0_9GLOM|nr:hypothetical protein C2G38_2250607 [Gigaspora rosea]